jgi:hypothetical protein
MSKVTIYQFDKYDITKGEMVKGNCWGTRQAIMARDCHVLEHTATEVDESVLRTDEPGMSAIGFDPHAFSRLGIMR